MFSNNSLSAAQLPEVTEPFMPPAGLQSGAGASEPLKPAVPIKKCRA